MAKPQVIGIEIPAIKIERAEVTLIGDSPLIVHAWSEKAKEMIRRKQQKKASPAKEAKNPRQEFFDSLYYLSPRSFTETEEDNTGYVYGFPTVAFKAAAVAACRFADGIAMTEARGAFHVEGELVRIEGSEPRMREDMVRIGTGVADMRYRGEFWPWRVTLPLAYNANALSLEQIVNLFNTAGFGVGVGEWRPSSKAGGSYGRFHVETSGDMG